MARTRQDSSTPGLLSQIPRPPLTSPLCVLRMAFKILPALTLIYFFHCILHSFPTYILPPSLQVFIFSISELWKPSVLDGPALQLLPLQTSLALPQQVSPFFRVLNAPLFTQFFIYMLSLLSVTNKSSLRAHCPIHVSVSCSALCIVDKKRTQPNINKLS